MPILIEGLSEDKYPTVLETAAPCAEEVMMPWLGSHHTVMAAVAE